MAHEKSRSPKEPVVLGLVTLVGAVMALMYGTQFGAEWAIGYADSVDMTDGPRNLLVVLSGLSAGLGAAGGVVAVGYGANHLINR